MKYKCYLFLKDDLEVDPELLKGTDRMKAQGIGAPICVRQSQKILFQVMSCKCYPIDSAVR